MPEMVADLLQRQPLFQQMSGAGVPQGVGAIVRQGHVQGMESPLNHLSQAAPRQRPEGRPEGEEHLAPSRPGAGLPEVTEDGIPDRPAQRVDPRLLPLAGRDGQGLVPPIEVLQAQAHDFAGAEAVDRQEHQQGTIPDVDGSIPLRSSECPAHLLPGGPPRQGLVVKHPRGHDRGRQAGMAPTPPFGVPEERPQG